MKIGDRILLIRDVEFSNGMILKAGNVVKVSNVGTRYGLPFIYPSGYPHERQLQFNDYELI